MQINKVHLSVLQINKLMFSKSTTEAKARLQLDCSGKHTALVELDQDPGLKQMKYISPNYISHVSGI